eukprot:CAMPEP_0167755034 /NCGR_PEP_ID=MMETSP0110_2-20121227/8600_1 /TAXON_ID=629695 /ORGANISM="Gymnochlora sp., Strain CCMP2014" /LENGTH=548 /DNA_ID=CAMNT_0007640977 /DNA_START=23 /DNA_END=1670 /DNA_ORIENTATION=+
MPPADHPGRGHHERWKQRQSIPPGGTGIEDMEDERPEASRIRRGFREASPPPIVSFTSRRRVNTTPSAASRQRRREQLSTSSPSRHLDSKPTAARPPSGWRRPRSLIVTAPGKSIPYPAGPMMRGPVSPNLTANARLPLRVTTSEATTDKSSKRADIMSMRTTPPPPPPRRPSGPRPRSTMQGRAMMPQGSTQQSQQRGTRDQSRPSPQHSKVFKMNLEEALPRVNPSLSGVTIDSHGMPTAPRHSTSPRISSYQFFSDMPNAKPQKSPRAPAYTEKEPTSSSVSGLESKRFSFSSTSGSALSRMRSASRSRSSISRPSPRSGSHKRQREEMEEELEFLQSPRRATFAPGQFFAEEPVGSTSDTEQKLRRLHMLETEMRTEYHLVPIAENDTHSMERMVSNPKLEAKEKMAKVSDPMLMKTIDDFGLDVHAYIVTASTLEIAKRISGQASSQSSIPAARRRRASVPGPAPRSSTFSRKKTQMGGNNALCVTNPSAVKVSLTDICAYILVSDPLPAICAQRSLSKKVILRVIFNVSTVSNNPILLPDIR